MEFEDYTAARDLFYLAALFAGAGIGCVLNRFRIKSTLRSRNRAVTLAFCLFSGMVAALAGSLIYSTGLIVFERPLYIPAAIAAALVILALRFPRAAAFPLILAAGCAVIWIGYSFLRFPLIAAGEPLRVSVSPVSHDGTGGTGQYALRFASPRGAGSGQDILIRLEGRGRPEDRFLEFSLAHLSYPAFFPLIGGENRGIVTGVRGEDEVFYADPRFAGNLLRGWYGGLGKILSGDPGGRFFEESREKVPVTDILPGMALELGFDGG
jgi:hypothetical protein